MPSAPQGRAKAMLPAAMLDVAVSRPPRKTIPYCVELAVFGAATADPLLMLRTSQFSSTAVAPPKT